MVQPLKPAWSRSKLEQRRATDDEGLSPDQHRLVERVLEITDENDQLREFAQLAIEAGSKLKVTAEELGQASDKVSVMLNEYHDLLRDVKAFLRADEVPEAMARISQQEREWWPDEAREV
ncbi:MAG TPA: hypothetical protein DIU18_07395 [Gemmatimonadetes bacterium]|nr:hypothetical protein [Gemmatimonadota bacterium]|tara:strand:- start:526 stop:885 length:360 start_codon:yes stop_codon:yes gene_type:complete